MTTADVPVRPADAAVASERAEQQQLSLVRHGPIGLWAFVGVLAVALCSQTWIRWILSDEEFDPAPVLGPDEFPTWRLVLLRFSEVMSVIEMLALFTFVVVIPLRRYRRLGLDAKIALGCLMGSVTDGILNMHEYLFAWNAHSVNMGSWAAFMPLASPDHQSRYAEALLWGVPMYTYFCIGVGIMGVKLIVKMRRRWPKISNATALFVVFALAWVFDFVVENFFIRIDHGYAYAKTPSLLTINDGSQYQFPLYESTFVALLGMLHTYLRLTAHDSPDGVSFVERGFHRFHPRLQGPMRWLAVIGFCMFILIVVYHIPWNWLGVNGDSYADLPSYMLPGD